MTKFIMDMNLIERKIDLILRLYVDQADQDYLSARTSYHNGIFHSFYWSAAQCVEKYMKAFILLQDGNTSDLRHDLVDIFNIVKTYDVDEVIPERLDIPKTTALGYEAWHEHDMALYVDYLNIYGSPDNRYGFNGTFINGPVLHALDILCHALRRAMRTENFTDTDLFNFQNRFVMCHEKTFDEKDWMIDPRLLLERLYDGRYHVGQDEQLRFAFLNMNLIFTEERPANEGTFGGQHFLGSPLYNHLVRLKKLDDTRESWKAIEELRAWAAKNIRMSKKVRQQLGLLDR